MLSVEGSQSSSSVELAVTRFVNKNEIKNRLKKVYVIHV
jgi:hypothetical protein